MFDLSDDAVSSRPLPAAGLNVAQPTSRPSGVQESEYLH